MAAEARRCCRLAAGKRRKLAARAAPMAGLTRGAAVFLPFGLGTRRGIFRRTRARVNPKLAALEVELRVEDGLAGRDAAHGVPEPVHVGDPVLEEVAHALLPRLE